MSFSHGAFKGEGDNALQTLLCRKEGEHGRAVLHVATMQSCFRLVKQMIDLISIDGINLINDKDGILKVCIHSLDKKLISSKMADLDY